MQRRAGSREEMMTTMTFRVDSQINSDLRTTIPMQMMLIKRS